MAKLQCPFRRQEFIITVKELDVVATSMLLTPSARSVRAAFGDAVVFERCAGHPRKAVEHRSDILGRGVVYHYELRRN